MTSSTVFGPRTILSAFLLVSAAAALGGVGIGLAAANSLQAGDPDAMSRLFLRLALLGGLTVPSLIALGLLAKRRLMQPLEDFQRAAEALTAEVTQRQTQLMEQQRFNALLLDAAGEGIVGVDAGGLLTFVNTRAARITGYDPEQLIGKPLVGTLYRVKTSGTRNLEADSPILASLRDGLVHHASNEVFWHEDDTTFPVEYTSTPILDGESVVGAVFTFNDVSERLAAEAMIDQMAYYDSLTGLPNRLLFQDRLNQALAHARRHRRQTAVMMMDLDRFKIINDTLGHPVGDQVLKTVAERLLFRLREVDTVSRLGGDEFALVLPDLSETSDIAKIGQVIHEEVSRVIRIGEQELFVTPSVGISVYPSDGDDAVTLIKNAEVALYQAKDERNRYQLYAPAMNASASEWLQLESHLRRALERDELLLHYQPQINLNSGEIVGVEALIRWQHPEWGMVSPARFIPLAEETGLIVPISEWVLRTACAQNAEWQRLGLPPVRVAVNLSGRHLAKHAELVRHVDEALQATGLAPGHLELELTESILMEDVEAAIQTLSALSERGVKLSIDDFGTGYSSLSYLKRFPIDTLKIDQAFVREIASSEEDSAIVKAVIALAHSLRLNVIAEGVETDRQVAFLKDHACDEVQGYFFSRPLPIADLPAFLSNHRPQAVLDVRR
ncbi:Cyclic di-GMP phosphodiesterase Gmr [compost metagenome]